MAVVFTVWILVLLMTQSFCEEYELEIRMPTVSPPKDGAYLCTALNVTQNSNSYIIGYTPHAEVNTAHHMLMFGCGEPADESLSWSCGNMDTRVCGPGAPQLIIYEWGINAQKLRLPENAGFEVGGNSGIKYLVLQVRYGRGLVGEVLKDEPGLTLIMTHKKPKYLTGVSLLSSGSSAIPPHKREWNIDVDCFYNERAVVYPFAFRAHARSLGGVISGYRVRNNEWTLIAKDDPQKPQAFYPILNNVDIRQGDMLVHRCTYNAVSMPITNYIGATTEDLCSYFMMYYYNSAHSGMGGNVECMIVASDSLNFPGDE